MSSSPEYQRGGGQQREGGEDKSNRRREGVVSRETIRGKSGATQKALASALMRSTGLVSSREGVMGVEDMRVQDTREEPETAGHGSDADVDDRLGELDTNGERFLSLCLAQFEEDNSNRDKRQQQVRQCRNAMLGLSCSSTCQICSGGSRAAGGGGSDSQRKSASGALVLFPQKEKLLAE